MSTFRDKASANIQLSGTKRYHQEKMLQKFYRLVITHLVITVLFARLIVTSVVKFNALMLVS